MTREGKDIMDWKLWLDDQHDEPDMPFRHPPEGFVPAKTVAEAQTLITINGMPSFIDFDHDLGDGHDAPELIKWMVSFGQDYNDGYNEVIIPEYNVHSANPAGKLTIISLMETWKKVAAM
jgi:hypothetical protein